jgi:tetratricopeptide (TPR) repeat protein
MYTTFEENRERYLNTLRGLDSPERARAAYELARKFFADDQLELALKLAREAFDENHTPSGRNCEETSIAERQGVPQLSPEHVNRYVNLVEIGRSRASVVYKADDKDEGRTVAIKLLSHDASHDQRNREIRILTQLKGMVAFYGSGTTADGRRYLVMDYVRGAMHIDVYSKSKELSPAEVRALFVDLCDVVQVAHDNKIFHLDLKPSNILVDENGKVRVVDFGIAVSTQGERPSDAVPVGMTPRYASPEHMTGQESNKSDVFSLGLILYELLTGGDHPYGLGPEPTREDRAIAFSRAPKIALPRRVGVALTPVIHKAVRVDMTRRYDSVRQFAADVRNTGAWWGYVQARGEHSVTYRLLKPFVHPRLAAPSTAAAVVLGLLIYAVVQRNTANAERATAAKERIVADDSVKAAEQNFEDTHDVLFQQDGTGPMVKQMNARHLEFVENLIRLRGDDASIRVHIAHAYWRRGVISYYYTDPKSPGQPINDFETARRIQKKLCEEEPGDPNHGCRLAKTLLSLAGAVAKISGKTPEARAAAEECREIVTSLLDEDPENPEYLAHLATSIDFIAQLDKRGAKPNDPRFRELVINPTRDSINVIENAIRVSNGHPKYRWVGMKLRHNLANRYREMSELEQSEAEFRAAIKVGKQLVERYRSNVAFRQNLAMALNGFGELVSDNPNANIEALKEASDSVQEGKKHFEHLHTRNPDRPEFELGVGESSAILSKVLRRQGRSGEAIEESQVAVEHFDALANQSSDNRYRKAQIEGRVDLANQQIESQEYDNAKDTLTTAWLLAEKFHQAENNAQSKRLLDGVYHQLTRLYLTDKLSPTAVTRMTVGTRPRVEQLSDLCVQLADCIKWVGEVKPDRSEVAKYEEKAAAIATEAIAMEPMLRERLLRANIWEKIQAAPALKIILNVDQGTP